MSAGKWREFARGLDRLQLQTLLNRLHKHKSFVYGRARWGTDTEEVPIEPRANGRTLCSGCGRVGPGHDRLIQRRYQYVPMWGLAVFLLYAPRRVDCPRCGIKVEQVPWAHGKHRQATMYMWFLASWPSAVLARRGSGIRHQLESRLRSVTLAVLGGLANRVLDGVKAIGVDEIQWQTYQIDDGCKRLLWIGLERTKASFREFCELLGDQRSKALQFVCSDMWEAYLTVIAQRAGQAIHVPASTSWLG